MYNILLVEDAKFFRSVLKSQIEGKLGYSVTAVETFKEAVEELTSGKNFDLALLDLNLPDAPDGEIVDIISGHNLPSIIFSGSFIEEIRDQLEKPYVIDYVVKDSPASLNYVLNTVHRFFKNKQYKVLVVDDSKFSAKHMAKLLEEFNFEVIMAHNGQDALKAFSENSDLRLIITDFNMPDMNGVDVTKRIRAKKNRDELCIIGVSAYGTHALSAQFLKAGANDFLVKPFLTEEFLCRITLNMDALDKVHELDALVYTDLITGLKNRRYLEENILEILAQGNVIGQTAICCFIELNDFRAFNDRHGNDAGDDILKQVGRFLEQELHGTSLIVRYGGSQFCLVHSSNYPQNYVEKMKTCHANLCKHSFSYEGKDLKIGFSGAAVIGTKEGLDDIVNETKNAIAIAQQQGNCHFHIKP